MTYKEARKKFGDKVEAAGSLANAVKELGVVITIASISMIRSGARRPSWKFAGAIESKWGIPVAAWMRPPKKRKRGKRSAA